MRRQKRRSAMLKKIVVMFAAVVLIVAATIGGTLAWLTAETQAVTNTFTVGNIGLTLDESELKLENGVVSLTGKRTQSNDIYKMLPGAKYPKDPKLTISTGSEKCWVFVEVIKPDWTVTYKVGETEKTLTFDSFVKYEYDWGTQLTSVTDKKIYYMLYDPTTSGTVYYLLKDVVNEEGSSLYTNGSVSMSNEITKEMMDTIWKDGKYQNELSEDSFKLEFKAYAIQYDNLAYTANSDDAAQAKVAWDTLVAQLTPAN